MTSAPQHPVEVPPFQLQRLIPDVIEPYTFQSAAGKIQLRCAQALGSEIYAGCSNGELLRFALQADGPNNLQTYTLLSRQVVPGEKPIDEIVLVPSLSRALVLSDHQIHFYTIPSLDPYPIKPIRNVVTFAVDDIHLKRQLPPLSAQGLQLPMEPVDFCVVKRNGIAMFTMKDRVFYTKEIPLQQGGITLAKRTGRTLCIADKTHYSMLDLEALSVFQVLPVSQAFEPTPFVVKPSITVISQNEFLILSWTGASTLGLFVTGDGDPVRGTLEWPSHPEAICLDYPYITSLLPNNTIEIHSVDTQAIVQVVGAPEPSVSSSPSSPNQPGMHRRSSSTSSKGGGVDLQKRLSLISSISGYLVPSTQRSDKMRTVPVKLLRT
uniref:CNH domain-containing protein n=1 Tax=Psilocybe cubensis TaxID=181762 RepID=A0A8H8CKT2_PSICU